MVELLPLNERSPANPPSAGTALAIGNFDGVHRGHQAIAARTVERAGGASLVPTLLTFHPHPNAVLGPGAPPALTTLERKTELCGRLGIHRVVAWTFDSSFATWSPERFARDLLEERLGARHVIVGDNFRFGCERAGDLDLLRSLGEPLGFEVTACPMLRDELGPLSSTRVRAALASGDLDAAESTLGRPHSLSGIVERGDERGRTLGFPTANLGGVPEALPANGVYAVAVDELSDGRPARALAPGVMNVGVRPTLGEKPKRTIEIHLFDLARDLYGARLRVHLVARLRAERRFEGLDALKAQIAIDAGQARVRLRAIVPVGGAYG